MDKCLYNGEIIYASDVAKEGIDYETEIRKSNQLICCDPECKGHIIYKSGKIKVAHFAHKSGNTHCYYNNYASKMSKLFKDIRDTVSTRLRHITDTINYQTDIDVRISKNYKHITPITVCGTSKFAIDIMRCNRKAAYLDTMREEYKNLDYTPLPIVVEDISNHFNASYDTYFTLRYWLNYSKSKTVLIYNENEEHYNLCRLDEDTYSFNKIIDKELANNVFVQPISISELQLTENGFTVLGFDDMFIKWQTNKRKKLSEHIKSNSMKMLNLNKRLQNPLSQPEDKRKSHDDIVKEKTDYEQKIYQLMKELSQEINLQVTNEEFETYFKIESSRKSKILYKLFPDKERLKSRMCKQITLIREKNKN